MSNFERRLKIVFFLFFFAFIGALKAAHAGISLSEAESSVASPFTSKNATIACVPNVIKEGRCALVTSIAIFKYMAAYSLVQFASVLTLYTIDSNLTDIEFLYIDLFMISIFAFFFGKTEAYVGPLVKQTPLNSLISLAPIASLVIHLVLAVAFQLFGWVYLKQQSWYEPFKYIDNSEFDHKCYENYTIFIISCFQYIILAVVFSKGAPYRKSIFTNIGFICSLGVNTLVIIVLAVAPWQKFTEWFDLLYPPDSTFHITLVAFGFINFALSMCVEFFVIENLLFRRLRYRFHNIGKSRRKFLAIENFLRQQPSWPPISQFGNDVSTSSNSNTGGNNQSSPASAIATVVNVSPEETDHQSPKSFTEICVESDFATPLDSCNSVLKGFFDNLSSDSEMSDESDIDDADTFAPKCTYGTSPQAPIKLAISENNVVDNSDKELSPNRRSSFGSANNSSSPTDTLNKSNLLNTNNNHSDLIDGATTSPTTVANTATTTKLSANYDLPNHLIDDIVSDMSAIASNNTNKCNNVDRLNKYENRINNSATNNEYEIKEILATPNS